MDKTYSGFSADPNVQFEIVVDKVMSEVKTIPMKTKIGKPVWIFAIVENPDRRWWQFWKPKRVIHPAWSDLYEEAKKHHKEAKVCL